MTRAPGAETYLDASPDAIFVASAGGDIEYASRRAADLFGGASPQEVVGRSLREVVERDDFARLMALLEDVRRGPAEVRLRGRGEALWAEASAGLVPGRGERIVLVVRDVSRRKRAEEALIAAKREAEETAAQLARALQELEQTAATDRLTGLYNRRHFEQVMAVELARSRRYGHLASLILVDVDHFKAVNDTFGHDAGDRVLVAIADAIAQTVRASDTACRWGGEEFAVLSPGVTAAAAVRLAERLREGVGQATVPGVPVSVTVSAGLVQLDPMETLELGFKRADQALYRAKANGRNRVEVAPGDWDVPEHRVVQLVWDPAFECGDAHLDAQHRRLFTMGNSVMDDAIAGAPTATLAHRFAALLALVKEHFADEERTLERIGYDGREQHAALHRSLIDQAERLEAQLVSGVLAVPDLLTFLVVRVVHDHIRRTDTQFFPALARALGASGSE